MRGLWRDAVVETGRRRRQPRVNRITYEICVLEALREQLRCKEVWVVGADRYRNPDEDLPADFDGATRRPTIRRSNLPLDADRFIADLQAEMRAGAGTASTPGLPSNPQVRIGQQARGLDHASRRSSAQPDPAEPDGAQGRGHRRPGR